MTPPANPSSPTVKPIPDNYPIVSPYLCVNGAEAAIEFYKKAFGAKERLRMSDPAGRVAHAEIEIGGGLIMLADEFPEMEFRGPKHYGGSSIIIHCYVSDVDALAQLAAAAGATIIRPVANQFYGDRSVSLSDPYGHLWTFSTHIEDVSPEEMKQRAKAKYGG